MSNAGLLTKSLVLLNSFVSSFKEKKCSGASNWSHLDLWFSTVTGVPASLVGCSLALNGLIFRRRVLSNFWKFYSLSRAQRLDPGRVTHPFLRAGLNKKGADKSLSQSMEIYLITNEYCIRLNMPTACEFLHQEQFPSFHKKDMEHLCLEE